MFNKTNATAPSFDAVVAQAIRGDLSQAVSMLRQIPKGSLTPKEAAAAPCMLARFEQKAYINSVVDDVPLVVSKVINVYQDYWHSQLLKTRSAQAAEAQLRSEIIQLLNSERIEFSATADLEQLTEGIVSLVERQGLFALTGITLPYYELMIWRKQEEKHYLIKLVEGEVDVPVIFLDDFVVSGWLRYATCGKSGIGGWTRPDKLFAVKNQYETSSEKFSVSYINHEGQHFFDMRQFPKLEQPELEYRAKLAELIAAQKNDYLFELLRQFTNSAAHGRDAPHPHAEYWLSKHLPSRLGITAPVKVEEWNAHSADSIRAAAREELLESSRQLRKLGASTVTRYLPD